MNDQFDNVAEAFSRKSEIYDAFDDINVNLQRMRQKVYDHFMTFAPIGSYVLELNAGTGLDASVLAGRGYRIHATDIAPGMLAKIEQKISAHGLQGQVTMQACSFTELDQVKVGPFDAVFSNSGGLNCIENLTAVTRHLPALLKPGATITWVIMPPIYPWELALMGKDWHVGTRRLRPGGTLAHVEGIHFKTCYFTPRQVQGAFGASFRQLKLEGLSIITPPADNYTFAQNHPRLYRWLVKLDDHLSHWPIFRGWGDFFILTMRYEP